MAAGALLLASTEVKFVLDAESADPLDVQVCVCVFNYFIIYMCVCGWLCVGMCVGWARRVCRSVPQSLPAIPRNEPLIVPPRPYAKPDKQTDAPQASKQTY